MEKHEKERGCIRRRERLDSRKGRLEKSGRGKEGGRMERTRRTEIRKWTRKRWMWRMKGKE